MTEHVWEVGQLCTCEYQGCGSGIVYRVIGIDSEGRQASNTLLTIQPVLGVIASVDGKRKRTIGAGWCQPLTAHDLTIQYATFGRFLLEEMKR